MNPELVDATALDREADRLGMRGLLPHLVRRLLGASAGIQGLVMPAEEGVSAHGFDGVINGGPGNAWVPPGASVWEMGAGQDPKDKAQKDYEKRTEKPLGVVPKDTAFVFVTPRRWAAGQDWAKERRQENIWRDVVVLDAEALHAWLETIPDVHVWLSERLGFQPTSVRTLSRTFEMLAARTRPALPGTLLLAGREEQAEGLQSALAGAPAVTSVRGGSREEAVAFMAAALKLTDIDADEAPDQPLWVRDVPTFDRLALSERPLTLVVAIDGVEVGHAAARGHHILLAFGGGDYDRSGVITLPRPARTAAREALEVAGSPFERAGRLAALARLSFAALLRELSVTPAGARPGWSTGDDASMLTSILLLGGWTNTDGDTATVQQLVDLTRGQVEQRLATLGVGEDAPWTRSGGFWRVVSPEDGFALLGEHFDDALLERWRAIALEVLGEIDPRLGMDMGARMMADLNEEARARFSSVLRRGVAEAAALLGSRGTEALPSGTVPARFSARLARDLLASANSDTAGKLWASLSELLPFLAEAAPDEFLEAVEDGLAVTPSPVLTLFQDAPGTSPLLLHSPHTGLLWALERLAWSPIYLQRVALELAELASREPGGTQGNRPSRSLRAIFQTWFPNTSADLPRRLVVIDTLRTRWPDVAWSLQLALLPGTRTVGDPIHHPQFRDWAPDYQPAAPEDLVQATHDILVRAIEDAGDIPVRWAELAGHLYALPIDDRDLLFEGLNALDPAVMESDGRLTLWRALVDEGQRHMNFPDAHWSMDRAQAERLLSVAERFAEDELPEHHARLFDHRVRLPDIPRDDFVAQERAVDELRQQAATEVLDRDGVSGLRRLAEACALPRRVGLAAGVRGDDIAAEVLPLLNGEGADAAMAAGWAAQQIREHGIEWARQQLDTIDLDVDGQTALMLELPADTQTWDLLDSLAQETRARYWQAARPFNLDAAILGRAVGQLLEYQRPWAAIDVLVGSARDGEPIDIDLAERTLEQAARSDQVNAAVHAAWEVGQLLDALETAGLAAERLARLEFVYFMLLDEIRPARALELAVASDPGLFVQLIRHGYVRADGADDQGARSELSAQSWQVLHDVRRLPGADEQGVIDPEQLRSWITTARQELAEADRADVGDVKIGELLSRSLSGQDGIWPAESVRDLIEELRSAPFESGIQCGRFNQRGVTIRDPYDGGSQEARLAAGLRADSEQLEGSWPRTARILRHMAEGYEADARQQDREAERRSDDS